jgi:hypothetical protein
MKRLSAAILAFFASAIGIAACGDPMSGTDWSQPDCSKYSSCSDCTWVVGCGWCFSGNGPNGTCYSGPEQCTASGSHWNWDPIGCHATADATPSDDATAE